MAAGIFSHLGKALASYLQKPAGAYVTYSVTPLDKLRTALQPADVLLVEGNSRISSAIKYLTQSTWSHAAICTALNNEGPVLIEADLEHGVRAVDLGEYADLNTRICRPVSLRSDETAAVCRHMNNALGHTYDLKNIFDLARYLLPQPPVPRRFRRRMLSLGSGDPTRAICSTLIAEAFQSVRYPILPEIEPGCPQDCAREILRIRHHSLFVPRDFDLSPYFRIVKPTIETGFDHQRLQWADSNAPPTN